MISVFGADNFLLFIFHIFAPSSDLPDNTGILEAVPFLPGFHPVWTASRLKVNFVKLAIFHYFGEVQAARTETKIYYTCRSLWPEI